MVSMTVQKPESAVAKQCYLHPLHQSWENSAEVLASLQRAQPPELCRHYQRTPVQFQPGVGVVVVASPVAAYLLVFKRRVSMA